MKRTDMVNSMVEFYESIPEGASSYHKMDMLLSRLERLGMYPPQTYMKNMPKVEGNKVLLAWEPENEEE